LLVICATAGLAAAGITAAWRSAPVRAAANPPAQNGETARSSATPNAAATKPIVIASGVEARALAAQGGAASAGGAKLYLTAANSPNRVLTLLSPGFAGAIRATSSDFPAVSPASEAAILKGVAQLIPFTGTGQPGSLGDGGMALLAELNLKFDSFSRRSGVAVFFPAAYASANRETGSLDGTVFIADTLNGTIRRVTGANGNQPRIITSIAGQWADSAEPSQSAKGGRENATLQEPMGIALDAAGNLYIADYAAGAVDVLRDATSSDSAASLELLAHVASPASIAVTRAGERVFVASPDTGAVIAIDTASRAMRALQLAGPTTAAANQAANRCARAGQQVPPADCAAGLAVDGAGNLFVAELTSGRIVRVDAKTGATTMAATGLQAPGDMAFDGKGNLFVSEQGRAQVDEFVGMGAPVSNLAITAPGALPPPTPPQVCTALQAQPNAFNFCNEPISGATPAQTFTVTNNTASTVTGLAIAVNPAATPPNFTIQGSSCTPTLSAGASCAVQLEFTPQQSGEIDAALTATDDAGDSASSEVGGTGIDFQLALANGQSTLLNVVQGGSVTFNLQVVPDSTFAGTVTFACPHTAPGNTMVDGDVPPYTSCTFTPASQAVSAGTPVNFSVTFQTTLNFIPPSPASATTGPWTAGGKGSALAASSGSRMVPAALFPALALAGLAAFVVSGRGRRVNRPARMRHALAALALAGLVTGAGLMSGCHHNTPNPAIETTPAGTTTMNITGTAQGVARGVPITLQVVAAP
jgi:hypothetical protein